MIFRKLSSVVDHSRISTLNGKSDSAKSSDMVALRVRSIGDSDIITRSRSEYLEAVQLALEPNAHTVYFGTFFLQDLANDSPVAWSQIKLGHLTQSSLPSSWSTRYWTSLKKDGISATTSKAISSL